MDLHSAVGLKHSTKHVITLRNESISGLFELWKKRLQHTKKILVYNHWVTILHEVLHQIYHVKCLHSDGGVHSNVTQVSMLALVGQVFLLFLPIQTRITAGLRSPPPPPPILPNLDKHYTLWQDLAPIKQPRAYKFRKYFSGTQTS